MHNRVHERLLSRMTPTYLTFFFIFHAIQTDITDMKIFTFHSYSVKNCTHPFHIVTGSLKKKSINIKFQLYHRDAHVQVLFAFNDESAILLI